MDLLAFEHHLLSPQGRDRIPVDAAVASVGGFDCCDQVRLGVVLEDGAVRDAGFQAEGCGAATAAASAAVALVRGRSVLEAARVGPDQIAAELGGLSSAKHHAAELAADALARALGYAVRRAQVVPAAPGRTLVAMSGGVDSAVAALLCSRRRDTVAVTLELWADTENDGERSCCSASAVSQARRLAQSMGLPHLTLDLRREFRAGVVEPFISGYAGGETPNPCVGCNGHVRIDAMLDMADRLGCERLATGHYARLAEADDPRGPLLRVAADPAKDQTYMLAALAPRTLARMTFPLGELRKPEVRAIAADAGLPVADKVDSQDLCFLAGTTRQRFLARHGGVSQRLGEIVDTDGQLLGHHQGQHNYTVGQRRGLCVPSAEPLYVLSKDAGTNQVIVGPRAALYTERVALRAVVLRRSGARVSSVKLRYRSRPLPGRLVGSPEAGRPGPVEVALREPADAAAPGQLACLMDGELVIGTGTITAALPAERRRPEAEKLIA
ncbi:MAG TPA: tRNA 2-thiouridine(34) synthase MnmA [Solirubrobacteraceae bacterium]